MPAADDGRSGLNVFDASNAAATSRRERSWLLHSNRKLRHLQGISLRNLTLSSQGSRPRGKTIDDESLPQTWKSPTKLLTQRESRELGHSKSSSDLSIHTRSSAQRLARPEVGDDAKPRERPSAGRNRRRSTLSWSQGTFGSRQRKLEDVVGERMADTWFSIHCEAQTDPVYVSEVVSKAMNPSFRFFDLKACGPSVTRLDSLTVKIWAKSVHMQGYDLLLELQPHLRSLQFMGKSLENFHHPLPPNCVTFHLVDGVYANLTDIPPYEPPLLSLRSTSYLASSEVKPTSSFDALMRLSTLDECIQDALATRSNLAAQIESMIEAHRSDLDMAPQASQARESLAATKRALAAEKRQLKVATKARAELRTSLQARREAMVEGRRAQERGRGYLDEASSKLGTCGHLVRKNKEGLQGQQRRIVEDLMQIYPIEPVPKRPLHFTIASLPLPNSSFSDPSAISSSETTIAAAIGYVAHIVYLVSFYLSVPLPYPIQPHSSTSTIHDPISLLPNSSGPVSTASAALTNPSSSSSTPSITPSRVFPLFPGRSSIPYRFEYGVFLLNKNLERLMAAKGLKALDLRQTLPNLKYLLEVIRGGEGGVVPDRKRGVFVRALTGLGRRDSNDFLVGSESGQGSEAASPSGTDGPASFGSVWGHRNGSAKGGARTALQSAAATDDEPPEPKRPGFFSSGRTASQDSAEPGDRARELVERDAEGLMGRLKRQAVS